MIINMNNLVIETAFALLESLWQIHHKRVTRFKGVREDLTLDAIQHGTEVLIEEHKLLDALELHCAKRFPEGHKQWRLQHDRYSTSSWKWPFTD